VLDLGIDLDVWPWIWLVVAVIFTLIELTILGGNFILLPFAISAFAASMLAFYDVSVEVQWIVFVLGGAVLFALFYGWSKRFLRDNLLAPGVGAARLVGLTGTVTVAISPDDTERHGRVTVDGEVWGALAADDVELPAGTRVRVKGMQGTRIVVEPVTPSEAHPEEGTS
jgi:membrane protein implicated in regulation of membrane protease activity